MIAVFIAPQEPAQSHPTVSGGYAPEGGTSSDISDGILLVLAQQYMHEDEQVCL